MIRMCSHYSWEYLYQMAVNKEPQTPTWRCPRISNAEASGTTLLGSRISSSCLV